MALNNLRLEVIELRNEGLEKTKLSTMLRPKPIKPRLKTFGDNWPKLRRTARSHRLTKRLVNIGIIN
jgi:hypothetical protein